MITSHPLNACFSALLMAGHGKPAGVRVAGQMLRFVGLQPAAHS